MRAISTGISHLNVEARAKRDAEMTNKTMVKLMSDDESEEEIKVADSNDSFAPSAQHRRANRAKQLRDEQSSMRADLINGKNLKCD